MRRSDVTLAARTDGQRRAGAPRRAEHHAVTDNRRRDDFERRPRAVPELRTGVGVIPVHAVLTVDDDLVVAIDANRHRGAPADTGVARRAPQLLAGPRIEGGDEGAPLRV